MVKQSKRVVTGAHYGLKDWLAQRITAVLMTAYLFLMIAILFTAAPQGHADWKALLSHQWLRIATFIFLACLFWHAWIGVRNVLMDYVHPTAIRLTLQVMVMLSLVFYLVWSAEILWS